MTFWSLENFQTKPDGVRRFDGSLIDVKKNCQVDKHWVYTQFGQLFAWMAQVRHGNILTRSPFRTPKSGGLTQNMQTIQFLKLCFPASRIQFLGL